MIMNAKLYFSKGKKILDLTNGTKYDVTSIIKDFVRPQGEKIYRHQYKIEHGKLTTIEFRKKIVSCKIEPLGTNIRKKASQAPYNFVSLDSKVVEYDQESKDRNLHGYIDYDITTLTPTFIRGEGASFYKEGGTYAIPGSSQRGMLLTICEILSSARLKYFDKERYMFDRRTDHEDNEIKPGFLTFKDGQFLITPSPEPCIEDRGDTPFQYYFNQDPVEFTTGSASGVRKWIFKKPVNNVKKLRLESKIIRQYDTDEMRNKDVPHILNCIKKGKIGNIEIPTYGLPIFYELDDKGAVSYISHCKLGRKRFSKKYSEHLPAAHSNHAITDFVDIMFGSTELASRILVEPALLEGEVKEHHETVYPKLLLSPKPKSGKNYLKSSNGSPEGGSWENEQDELRGHKLYWHRITDDKGGKDSWLEKNVPANKANIYPDKIEPLLANNTFKGRIRYEGISAKELGCLLWALRLEEGCAHKIGMGKPLGLGSVKISILTVTDINLTQRYAGLFDGDGWMLGERDITSEVDKFISTFKKAAAGEDATRSDRLKEFFHISTFDEEKHQSPQWLEKTAYIDFKEFGNRSKLPDATDVS